MSIENRQARHNSYIANAANISGSNDASQQVHDSNDTLIKGAQVEGLARTFGLSEEEKMALASRLGRRQKQQNRDNREISEFNQRNRSLIADLPSVEVDGTRTVSPQEAELLAAGGERTQDELQNFGGFDPKTGRTKDYGAAAEEQANARSGKRDSNVFTRFDRDLGRQVDVYVPEGKPTPDEFRDYEMLRSYGLKSVKTGEEAVLNKRGEPVYNQQGEPVMRNTYDAESMLTETGKSQRGPLSDAHQRLIQAVESGKVTMETVGPDGRSVADILGRLEEDMSPQVAIGAEKALTAEMVKRDAANVNPAAKAANDEAARRRFNRINATTSQGKENIAAIPEPGQGFGNAVPLNEESIAIARALGGDVSGYVDADTGIAIPTADRQSNAPSNIPNSSNELNAPQLTDSQKFIADRMFDAGSDTGSGLRQVNLVQASSDFSRRVNGFAPSYRTQPVRDVASFENAVQTVIDAGQAQGKKFYLRNPETGKNERSLNPGVHEALQMLRMSEPEKADLANALFQLQSLKTSQNDGAVGPGSNKALFFANMADQMTGVSPGVSLSTGGVPGSNRIDYAKPKSSTQRAAFARAESQDAQEPFIGAIGEEPRTTRQVSKGRTPEQVEQVMREYAAKKGEQVDPVKLEKYKRDNASLRADQARTEENAATRELMRRSKTGPLPARQTEDAQFFTDAASANAGVERQRETAEKAELARLMNTGAKYDASASEPGIIKRRVDQGDGTTIGSFGEESQAGRKLVSPQIASAPPSSGGTRPTAVAASPEPQRGGPMPQSMRQELMSLPGPVRDASDQLKTEIAARVDQKRRGRRNSILKAGGLFAGGVGIGAGIDAYNGSREEQYQ